MTELAVLESRSPWSLELPAIVALSQHSSNTTAEESDCFITLHQKPPKLRFVSHVNNSLRLQLSIPLTTGHRWLLSEIGLWIRIVF